MTDDTPYARQLPAATSIPQELRDRPQWVCWRLKAPAKPGGKPGKEPINPRTGGGAVTTKPATWGTYEQAVAHFDAVPSMQGLGFVFSKDDPYTVIDLDHCYEPLSDTLEPWARQITDQLRSWTELSPGGEGLHIIVRGTLEGLTGNKRGDIEMYDHSRFITITGRTPIYVPSEPIQAATIYDRQDELTAAHASVWGEPVKDSSPNLKEAAGLLKDRTAEEWERDVAAVAAALQADPGTTVLWAGNWEKLGFSSQSDADYALCVHLAYFCKGDPGLMAEVFAASGLYRDKWDRPTYREPTIEAALKATAPYRPVSADIEVLDAEPTPQELAAPAQAAAAVGAELAKAKRDTLALTDFYAYLPNGRYIFNGNPTGEMWVPSGVDGQFPMGKGVAKASDWLRTNRYVTQMAWDPGQPEIISNKALAGDSWHHCPGSRVYNTYRGPGELTGNPKHAGPWLDHVKTLYGRAQSAHILSWLACKVQRPGLKINHALVLGGQPGSGKDTLLLPVRTAVGAHNFNDITPQDFMGTWNGWVASVVVRINEASNTGSEIDRYAFYEHSKSFFAAPPETIRVNIKHVPQFPVRNVAGYVITTNHLTGALHLPADDRRHYVAWSSKSKEQMGGDPYYEGLYRWLADGGAHHVAAYLATYDWEGAGFNPHAPPPLTQGFHEMVDAGMAEEETELSDVLDLMGRPEALTIEQLKEAAGPDFVLPALKKLPHQLRRCGYEKARNDNDKRGRWGINQVFVYVRSDIEHRRWARLAEKLAENRK